LVNVVAGRQIAPEFVQDALEPLAVARALEPLLNLASDDRRTMIEALNAVRASLGQPGAAGRVAVMALELAEHATRATRPG
jgi:lipid-A-disaccharide synthase